LHHSSDLLLEDRRPNNVYLFYPKKPKECSQIQNHLLKKKLKKNIKICKKLVKAFSKMMAASFKNFQHFGQIVASLQHVLIAS